MASPQFKFVLEQPIPGFNHLRAFNQDELGVLIYDMRDVESAGVARLDELCAGWGGRHKWTAASDGLKIARALIILYKKWLDAPQISGRKSQDLIEKNLALLHRLESVLDQADIRDIRYTIVVTH